MLVEVIYLIAMIGVIASNGLILIAQYQLRRSSSKTSVNVYVASLSVSAIIFAVIFGPTVFTARFQTLAPPSQTLQLLCQTLDTSLQRSRTPSRLCLSALKFQTYRHFRH